MRQCCVCGEQKPPAAFSGRGPAAGGGLERRCRECKQAQRRARYQADPSRERGLQDLWAAANRDRINERARERRQRALAEYSLTAEPSCACCGEGTAAFLTFEHTEGGGNRHRQSTGGGGFISWLLVERRDGIEVLCMNCNHGRRVNGGVCPHDELARELLVPTWA